MSSAARLLRSRSLKVISEPDLTIAQHDSSDAEQHRPQASLPEDQRQYRPLFPEDRVRMSRPPARHSDYSIRSIALPSTRRSRKAVMTSPSSR